jgi:hypothetical protein
VTSSTRDYSKIPPRVPRTAYTLGGTRRSGTRCGNCNMTYYSCSKKLWELKKGPCCEECEQEDMHDVPSLAELREQEQAREAVAVADWLTQHSFFAASKQGDQRGPEVRQLPAQPPLDAAHLAYQVDVLRTRLAKVKAYLKYIEGRSRTGPTIEVAVHPAKKRTDPRVKNLRKATVNHRHNRQRQREESRYANWGPEYF